MPVPLLDVNAQNHPLRGEIETAFRRVFESGQFIMGGEISTFEQALLPLAGTRHAVAVSSGTDALLLALMALGVGPGDEVLVPAFTFFATAGCVSRCGAMPVFVDVCPVCFNIDIQDAKSKLSPRTRAILPVHLFGQSADMEAILAVAREYNLLVIEDAAQALGATYKGARCGSMGDAGIYSFFPSKNLGGFGDSGAFVCNDHALSERARTLRMHGMQPKYYHSLIGANFRMDPLQAAMLGVKLPHYAAYTANRRMNAAFYTEQLSKLPGVIVADPAHCRCTEKQDAYLAETGAKLVLPVSYEHNGHIWNQYTLRVIGDGRRDALKKHLTGQGIGCEIYYPVTLDQQACYATLPEASRRGCDVAHRLSSEVLSIPIYPELTESQKQEVVETIAAWL